MPRSVTIIFNGEEYHYLSGLVRGLLAASWRINLVVPDSCPLVAGDALAIHHLRGPVDPSRAAWRKAWGLARYYSRLMRLAVTTRDPMIHLIWFRVPFAEGVLYSLFLRLLGKRVVHTAHNVLPHGSPSALARWTYRRIYRLMDGIIVHTSTSRDRLVRECSVSPTRIAVIPHPVNDAVAMPRVAPEEARRQLHVDPKTRLLLFFGNVLPYKGLEVLLRAVAVARRDLPDLFLLVAGKSSQEYGSSLVAAARQLHVDDMVRFDFGFVPDDLVGLYLASADALVLPYLAIDQSGVLLLGLSHGVPAIVSDVGGLSECVRDGEEGYLARPGDPDDLAKCLIRFYTDMHPRLPQLRAVIRESAHDRYGWDRISRMTSLMYDRLIRGAEILQANETRRTD